MFNKLYLQGVKQINYETIYLVNNYNCSYKSIDVIVKRVYALLKLTSYNPLCGEMWNLALAFRKMLEMQDNKLGSSTLSGNETMYMR